MNKRGFRFGVLFVAAIPVMWWSLIAGSDSTGNVSDGLNATADQPVIEAIILSEENDIDRLTRISERYSRISGNQIAAIFGSSPSSGTPFVSVDYGIFNRLSDDGVAVYIAEAFLRRNMNSTESNPSPRVANPSSSRQSILENDEQVGRLMAKAGYRKEGFKEWLDTSSNLMTDSIVASLPSNLRESAFLRGYESVSTQR
jgi:hypothetical protein